MWVSLNYVGRISFLVGSISKVVGSTFISTNDRECVACISLFSGCHSLNVFFSLGHQNETLTWLLKLALPYFFLFIYDHVWMVPMCRIKEWWRKEKKLHLYKVVGNPFGGSNPLTISRSGKFSLNKKEWWRVATSDNYISRHVIHTEHHPLWVLVVSFLLSS